MGEGGRWDVGARDRIGITGPNHGTQSLNFPTPSCAGSVLTTPHTPPIMAGRKTLLAPIHFIFSLLQKRSTVSVWLYEQLAFRIEGKIRVGRIQHGSAGSRDPPMADRAHYRDSMSS